MKENSIKEDIKRIKQRIEDVKEYLEYGLPYSEYLDLENSFEHILSDYKRVLKENEIYSNQLDLFYIDKNYISKQKVKDKIEELEEELEIMKVDNMYGRYKEYGGKTKWEKLFTTKYGMHDALQELLEGR